MATIAGFRVTYPSGLEEVCLMSDGETVEHFVNTKFGSVDYKEGGVKVKTMTSKQVEDYQRGLSEAEKVAAEVATPQETLHELAAEMEAVAADAPAKEKPALLAEAEQMHKEADAAPATVSA